MIQFTKDEVGYLRSVMIDWINDGFTTPPYDPPFYTIVEKLRIKPDDDMNYTW